MATKAFCDKCWAVRVRNNTLQNDDTRMPTLAAYSVTGDSGSKADTCEAHLLETITGAFRSGHMIIDEVTIRVIH